MRETAPAAYCAAPGEQNPASTTINSLSVIPCSEGLDRENEYLNNQIRSLIDENPMSGMQIGVVMICFFLNMLDGMDVLLVSYVAPVLANDWSISPASLGGIFSAGLAGMAVGSLVIAPLADNIGRKRMMIVALLTISIGMLFTGTATTVWQLVGWRFWTGLGIGAILAGMATLVSEFSSRHRRNLSVGFLQSGYAIGAIIAGFSAAWIIPNFGWKTAFVTAGIVTALMLPIVIFVLPESIEFLATKQPSNALDKINSTLRKAGYAALIGLPPKPQVMPQKTRLKDLFSENRATSTSLLWAAFFFCFMTLYFAISWITKSAVDAGLPLENAIYAGTTYNIGAFTGTILVGWVSVRFSLQRTIFFSMLLAATSLLIFGWVHMSIAQIFTTTFLMGIFLGGGFNALWPLATRLYPTHIRATGVGWAVGASRSGAVIGPLLAGHLLGSGVSLGVTFTVFAVPIVIGATCARLIRPSNLAC